MWCVCFQLDYLFKGLLIDGRAWPYHICLTHTLTIFTEIGYVYVYGLHNGGVFKLSCPQENLFSDTRVAAYCDEALANYDAFGGRTADSIFEQPSHRLQSGGGGRYVGHAWPEVCIPLHLQYFKSLVPFNGVDNKILHVILFHNFSILTKYSILKS